jgi:hypothetical protein
MLALLIFVAAQALFFMPLVGVSLSLHGATDKRLDVGDYSLLTFGALVFMIAGLYLPQMLKLKVGVIELQKSSIDQISTAVPIAIRK